MNYNQFDITKIRADFPILQREVNGLPLVYFDNAATSQTPKQVIDVITDYYSRYNANIHPFPFFDFIFKRISVDVSGKRSSLIDNFPPESSVK